MSIAIIGGVAAVGVGAYGASQAGKTASPPPPRNINEEIATLLEQGPNLYRSTASLAPAYNDLRLQNLQQLLWGTPAGANQPTDPGLYVPRWRNIQTGQVRTDDPARAKGTNQTLWEQFWAPQSGSGAGGSPVGSGAAGSGGTGGSPAGGQPGLVAQYQSLIAPTNAANTATRTSTYNDIRGLNPDASALFDELTRSASLGLKAGSTISPEDQFKIANPIRANNAARGFAPGGPGDLEEALALFGGGQNLLQQRQQTASGVADLSNRLYTLPTLSSAASTSPGGLLGAAAGSIPDTNVFNQLGGYGSDLFGTNYNASAAANIANANNRAAAGSALIGLSGKLGGTLLENVDWGG